MGSVYFPGRRQHLPQYASSSSSAVKEKMHAQSRPWLIPISVPIPGLRRSRALRIWILNPQRLHQSSISRFGYKRGSLVLLFALFTCVLATWALAKRFGTEEKKWPAPFMDPPTLVFRGEDLQKIWLWEIESGHYPSRRKRKCPYSDLCIN